MGMTPEKERIDQTALILSFQDTQNMIQNNALLRSQTERMLAGTRLYFPRFQAICPNRKGDGPELSVVEDTTFHCARTLINGEDKVAVLNFANAYQPGGGVVYGAMAQEECLCRSSNLYCALTLPYLKRNYYKWNSRNTGDAGTDAVIYSPGVTVFKTDDTVPVLMDTDSWFQVDVITCAAPYYDKGKRKPFSEEKLRAIFRDRIENILAVAAANDVDVLVLGAFGCGAFNNPPALVAEVFHDLLFHGGYGNCFRKIIFAIKTGSEQGMENYTAFAECFGRKS